MAKRIAEALRAQFELSFDVPSIFYDKRYAGESANSTADEREAYPILNQKLHNILLKLDMQRKFKSSPLFCKTAVIVI